MTGPWNPSQLHGGCLIRTVVSPTAMSEGVAEAGLAGMPGVSRGGQRQHGDGTATGAIIPNCVGCEHPDAVLGATEARPLAAVPDAVCQLLHPRNVALHTAEHRPDAQNCSVRHLDFESLDPVLPLPGCIVGGL